MAKIPLTCTQTMDYNDECKGELQAWTMAAVAFIGTEIAKNYLLLLIKSKIRVWF